MPSEDGVCPTGTTPVGDGFQCRTGSAPTCATGTPSGDNCAVPSEDGVCPTGTTPVGDGFQCILGLLQPVQQVLHLVIIV